MSFSAVPELIRTLLAQRRLPSVRLRDSSRPSGLSASRAPSTSHGPELSQACSDGSSQRTGPLVASGPLRSNTAAVVPSAPVAMAPVRRARRVTVRRGRCWCCDCVGRAACDGTLHCGGAGFTGAARHGAAVSRGSAAAARSISPATGAGSHCVPSSAVVGAAGAQAATS